jgi:hypothetical protein
MEDNLPDNTVDIFYLANRLVEILETDNKHIRAELEGFKQEIFHNIGANAVFERNN